MSGIWSISLITILLYTELCIVLVKSNGLISPDSSPRRPSGLVGNLHTCSCGSREFDSYQTRICVLSFLTESEGARVSKIQPLVDEL